jgi:hypothetical protein
MQADRSHLYFLLRSTVLVILFQTLWWFLLLNPLLFLLKGSVKIFGSMIYNSNVQQFLTETDSGEWEFQTSRALDLPNQSRQPGFSKKALTITMQPSDFYFFTFGIPVFWAIILASGIRRSYRPMILGTIAMTVIETALALALVELTAYRIMAQVSGSRGEFAEWFVRFGYSIVLLVIPFIAPFLVAIALHRELRWQIFRWGNPALLPQGDSLESCGRKADYSEGTRKRRRRAQKE